MKYISWNVNGIRACMNKGFMDFLKEHNPDMLGLQEVKAKPEQVEVIVDEIQDLGYSVIWNAAERPGYSGTALITKNAPLSIQHSIDTDADNEGRVIAAEFDDYYFITVYTPNAKNDLSRLEYRQDWDEQFLKFVYMLNESKPVIFCGDLNVAHNEIDLARPKPNVGKAGFTNEERFGMDEYIANGFVDTFRHKHPNTTDAYSWWSYYGGARDRNVGWRIDYHLVSESIADKVSDAGILPEVHGSDHCPVWLEMNW